MTSLEQPVFVVTHDVELSEEFLWKLKMEYGSPRNIYGIPIDPERIRKDIRWQFEKLKSRDILTLGWVPLSENTVSSNRPIAPIFSWVFSKLVAIEMDAESELTIDFPVLKEPLFRYAILSASTWSDDNVTFNYADPHWSNCFADACKRAVRALQSSFAFGGVYGNLAEPELRDPRSRAWPITYYGPELVKQLGLERIKGAPWHKTEDDPSGGLWCFLTELPFVPSPELEKRREGVERRLGLRERFSAAV